MLMPAHATEGLLFGRVAVCLLVPPDTPPTETTQRLMVRTAALFGARLA
jgi:hypothetical protein